MFDLKRPCKNCPFRKGQGELFRLNEDRLSEIFNAVAFQCHKTVDYDHYEDNDRRQGDKPQQCAGLMKLLADAGEPNQIMQVAMRLGALDVTKLDPDNEVYDSLWDAMEAHCAH